MSLLRYKFSSAVNYEQLHFDGVCLAVGELKRLVHEQRGDNPDQVNCDLVVRDSHSNQIYQDSDYISKNSSVIIMRIPKLNSASSSRVLINRHKRHQNKVLKNMIKENALPFNKNNLQANQHEEKISEEEKLKSILFGASSSSISSVATNSHMASTTTSYNSNSSNAAQELASLSAPGVNNVTTQKFMQGIPGDNYTCYRCGLKGHYINFCPKRDNNKIEVNNNPELVQHLQSIKYLKTNHGIPSSFMLKTDDPTVIGTRRLGDGTLGINIKDSFAILQGKKEQNPFANTQIDHSTSTDGRIDGRSTQIMNSSTLTAKQASTTSAPPDELTCPLCYNLLNEAAVAPCCGHSYCDLCIKTHLLQSQNSSCPSCATEIEVGSLIANVFLRNAVKKYKTTTDNAIYTDSTTYNNNNNQYIDPNNITGSRDNEDSSSDLRNQPAEPINGNKNIFENPSGSPDATSLSPTKCADTSGPNASTNKAETAQTMMSDQRRRIESLLFANNNVGAKGKLKKSGGSASTYKSGFAKRFLNEQLIGLYSRHGSSTNNNNNSSASSGLNSIKNSHTEFIMNKACVYREMLFGQLEHLNPPSPSPTTSNTSSPVDSTSSFVNKLLSINKVCEFLGAAALDNHATDSNKDSQQQHIKHMLKFMDVKPTIDEYMRHLSADYYGIFSKCKSASKQSGSTSRRDAKKQSTTKDSKLKHSRSSSGSKQGENSNKSRQRMGRRSSDTPSSPSSHSTMERSRISPPAKQSQDYGTRSSSKSRISNSHEKSRNSTTAHRSTASTSASLSACGPPSHTRTVKNSTVSASANAVSTSNAASSKKAKSNGDDQDFKSNSRVFNMLEIQDAPNSTNNGADQSCDKHLSPAVVAEDFEKFDFRHFTELTDDEEKQRAKQAKHDKQLDSAYCCSL